MSGSLSFPDGVWPPRWAHEFADNPAVLADVQREIGEAYEGTDYPRPDPGQVVRTVLADIARELREAAELDEECHKIDDCHAHAVVRYQLARWLSSVIIAHPQPEQTDADRAWLAEVARRSGLADG